MIKFLKYLVQAFFVYIFFLFAKFIGLNLSQKLSSKLFRLCGPLIKSNEIAKKNLSKFSKKINDYEVREILSNMWSNYGMTFVEYIFLNKFKKNKSHIKIYGKNVLEEVQLSQKPVIFVSGHFANFELMSMELVKHGINLATIYRPLNNYFLNPFMEYLRKKYVCKNQIKKGRHGVRQSIEYINMKTNIALMIDQRLTEGEKIEFFNEKAFTTTLPAQLSLKYSLKIVPIFIERKNNSFFEMTIHNPIDCSIYKNKVEITKKLNEVLEKMIIKNPNQWIWTHNRWK